jgi:hypothetical protein
MLDPLRSLAELVRTLTRPRADRRGSADETQRQRAASDQALVSDAPAASGVDALRERLRRRLRVVGTQDPRRARLAFVETVLASELGDAVTLDPQMSEIVNKVTSQLEADAATSRDLTLLFEELTRDGR